MITDFTIQRMGGLLKPDFGLSGRQFARKNYSTSNDAKSIENTGGQGDTTS